MTQKNIYEIINLMSQKGFSLLVVVALTALILGLGTISYYLYSKSDNPIQLFNRPKDQKLAFEQRNKKRLESAAVKKGTEISPISTVGMGISNPASEYCIKVGGDLQTLTRGDGGEYSICNFPDDQSCEEWALYRRKCPLGGVKTIGYDSPEEIYCVQLGGKTLSSPDSRCTLPTGQTCLNTDLYNGKCP